jgi:hypothetical protein
LIWSLSEIYDILSKICKFDGKFCTGILKWGERVNFNVREKPIFYQKNINNSRNLETSWSCCGGRIGGLMHMSLQHSSFQNGLA